MSQSFVQILEQTLAVRSGGSSQIACGGTFSWGSGVGRDQRCRPAASRFAQRMALAEQPGIAALEEMSR
jgi:hypothetical protein